MSRNQKVKREIKALLIDNNETLPTLSSVEGNNIAERLKQRRRGMSTSQTEIKRVELENPFLPRKSRRGAKRKRNEFIERLEENEPQIMQELEIATEENNSVWEPWDEITPTRHIRKLKGNVVSVVIEPKDVGKPFTREKRRRLQSFKETREEKKELDAVASLLAMANGKKVLRMMTPERASENLTDEASLRTPEPISKDLVSPFNVVPKLIKRGPKNVDYEIVDLTMLEGSNQSVLCEQDASTRSERSFEDNATQQKRIRVKKLSADMPSSLNVKVLPSFTEIKYAKELQNLDHHITRHFNKWEIELNSNINVLLYGFGSKEHILETYQAFDNKNENVTWIHFDGSGDLTDMNDAYLMLLDKILGPDHIFKNHTLIGKALGIRNYYDDVVSRIKFKIIVHNIDGYVFQSVDARYALNLLGDIPNIHFLATSENVSSCLGWYVNAEDKMNWHTHEVTKLSNYKFTVTSKEKATKDYRLKRKELKLVLSSWNTYRRGMFAMLADHIVTATRRSEANGDSLDFNTLFKYCLENSICNDEKTFRRYLEDFYFHGIFMAKRAPSGEVRITIPMSWHDLKALLLDNDIFGDIG
ncbi:uncharacterized protein OCT59_020559 [Rhizophagus irregularis]|uniref:Origin recognition complex subunit 2 n=2 Tax=Rhizophagus irregularis TaxID=588596 RepID=U9TK77_RHIID|nr:hypothetical protein GLOIN_2v1673727 [Rhizophagus irregularis DAOM 181602=DAOM 197198]EXX53922.1 hypothetical protein RirG_239470 [Rhizophagus irregularis DAOM 197198w]POG64607.1 hypothetical protein GLOIN_2v1673727 [Rhizophagus irregularis DAOM 181602=DAOM 197198]UZO02063.1 hypothetical protein OCT59_020559 [Rhizophagus irregularis]CAG8713464.1 10256_t:CDS:2 [Rhizophagus irregularis]|eukprot:XP_025171473.1 hypothetical protein GLOIN_2v1673727 [Rhizophagus irregularis DAOM 181602=DAOM 197198]